MSLVVFGTRRTRHFVMKVEGTTLKQIITSTRRGDLAIMKEEVSTKSTDKRIPSIVHGGLPLRIPKASFHRDLKPSNVVMELWRNLLLDWGLS